MKQFILMLGCLITACGHLTAGRVQFPGRTGTSGDIRPSVVNEVDLANGEVPCGRENVSATESATIIYYGLNGSNSRSWVRQDKNGVVGISYFQRFEGSPDLGTLIYKTIHPDGSRCFDSVTTGRRMEKSVLLYDSSAAPHIFVARSDDFDQIIEHYFRDATDQWQNETILHFQSEGGKFIYELSADTGPDGSFHLLILKTRSDLDSDDHWDAWIGSFMYHLTNASGDWLAELVNHFDMLYTSDMYIKTSCRQDLQIDDEGYAHVVFIEQVNGNAFPDPSRLWYATNRPGGWVFEVALSNLYGIRDDPGWFPSLALDRDGIPHISCMYVNRYPAGSAIYCRLLYLRRLGPGLWSHETVADQDDGYYGPDGRCFTGGLSHLMFDKDNTPHLVFTDIASAHWGPGGTNRLSVGNIRYGVLGEFGWDITTIYRQPLPAGFLNATEMYGLCLVVPKDSDSIRVIGQELVVTGTSTYTCELVDFALKSVLTDVDDDVEHSLPTDQYLSQNYPNPFNPTTTIEYSLPERSRVIIEVYNVLGQKVQTLVDRDESAGSYTITWDGTSSSGQAVSTGVYLYRFQAGDYIDTRKMLLLK